MRIIAALPILLLASGCNVSKDDNGVTVQYDQNTAENTVADVSNTAQEIGADIGNDVRKTGDKVQDKVGNADVDVKVNTDAHDQDKNKS